MFKGATTLFAAALLIASLAIQGRAAAADSFKPFKLKTPDGSQQALTDVLGKATLVVFFFPTCPYCNAAFPGFQKLYDSYKDRGLSMVWINVIPDEEKLIASWRTQHGFTVPVLLGGLPIVNDYNLTLTPTQFLLDPRGNVISRHDGYRPGDEQGLEREIKQALALP